MVASRQVMISFYRVVGRQRGRVFGAVAQVIGRTANSFFRKYIVPAGKRVGADSEFAMPEFAEIVSGRKKFKTNANTVGRQTLTKQLGERSRSRTAGSRERSASRVIPTKSAKQISRLR